MSIEKLRERVLGATVRIGRALGVVWASGQSLFIWRLTLVTVSAILPLYSLYIMKLILDHVATGAIRDGQLAWLLGVAALAAVLAVGVRWAADFIGSVQGEALSDHMRDLLQQKACAVDLAFFESADDHDRLYRALAEGPARPARIFARAIDVIHNTISLAVAGGLTLALSPIAAASIALSSLPAAYLQMRHARLVHGWTVRNTARERLAAYLNALLVDANEAKEMRALGAGREIRRRFREIRRQILLERRSLLARKAIDGGASHGFATLVVFGCFALLAHKVLQGSATLGDLALYYGVLSRGQDAIRGVLGGIATLREESLYITSLFEFLDIEPAITTPAAPVCVDGSLKGHIRVDGLSFRYSGHSEWALHQIDLEILPGQHIALVGENGSGKTTLVKLLIRLYDPTIGSIRVDGVDLRDVDRDEYRAAVGIMFQDPAQYQLSVQDNIWLRSEDDEERSQEISGAAESAGISRLVDSLPFGFRTTLGKWFANGVELSVGEWQKLGLARALARNPRILVLDEPTSALDPEAESRMIDSFRKVGNNRTLVTISHRLSTARYADVIHVLKAGSIVESGSHEALLSLDGNYARMFRSQAHHYG